MATRIDDLVVTGTTRLLGVTYLPADCVGDLQVKGDAAIDPDKQQHKHRKSYGQSGTVATATVPIHVVNGATATVISIKAGTIAICAGAATITIDLKKNGTSILTGVITLDSGNTARVVEAGVLTAGATAAVNNFFELVIVATAGGGTVGTGLLVEFEIDELAA
jgi:hypothetical protein